MFDGLKTSVAVLLGLVLGVIIACPLAWYGTRLGADSLAHNIRRDLSAVEQRQQSMADQALHLEELLAQKGYRGGSAVFNQVMESRSRLAGQAALDDKLQDVQSLEQALLLSEKVWEKAGRDQAALAKSFYYGEHGREWEKQKRLLVREQDRLVDSVKELDRLLERWPATMLLRYQSFGALLNTFFGDVAGNVAYGCRWGLDWVGYYARRVAALRNQQAPPEPPKWERPAGAARTAYMDPLTPPHFLADAPPPEDEYREVQFNKEVGEYADVDLGEQKAVLENRHAPQGYRVVVPKPQTTVTY